MKGRRLRSAGILGRHGGRALRAGEIKFAAGLRASKTAEAADWFVSGLLPCDRDSGTRVGAVIPPGFPCYARVFHPAWRGGEVNTPVSWKEVAAWSGREVHEQMQWEVIREPVGPDPKPPPWQEAPEVGRAPLEIRRCLVPHLERATTRHEACRVLVWAGWGGFEPDITLPDAARVRSPGREYVLFEAPLHVLADRLIFESGPWELAGPSVWWPEDRSWCVATEIDFRWTYVAGSSECISHLLEDPQLEALETSPEHRGDHGSDPMKVRT